MAEYIERRAAMREIDHARTLNLAYLQVASIPAADVVEVVRCGECVSGGRCYAENVFRFAGVENPYCCAGKRKDGEINGHD